MQSAGWAANLTSSRALLPDAWSSTRDPVPCALPEGRDVGALSARQSSTPLRADCAGGPEPRGVGRSVQPAALLRGGAPPTTPTEGPAGGQSHGRCPGTTRDAPEAERWGPSLLTQNPFGFTCTPPRPPPPPRLRKTTCSRQIPINWVL